MGGKEQKDRNPPGYDKIDKDGWWLAVQLVRRDSAVGSVVVHGGAVPVCATPEMSHMEALRATLCAAAMLQLPVRGPQAFEPSIPGDPESEEAAALLDAVRLFKEHAIRWRPEHMDRVLGELGEHQEKDKEKET